MTSIPLIAIAIGIGLFLMTKSMGESGRDLIKRLEGYSSFIYLDSARNPTIGYGHKLLPGESEKFKNGITKQHAENLLTQDMQFAINAVNYYVTRPLSQTQFDALVSFVYNVGAQAFANSTLLKRINAGDFSDVGNQLKRWKYITVNGEKVISPGLVNRREKETELFYT